MSEMKTRMQSMTATWDRCHNASKLLTTRVAEICDWNVEDITLWTFFHTHIWQKFKEVYLSRLLCFFYHDQVYGHTQEQANAIFYLLPLSLCRSLLRRFRFYFVLLGINATESMNKKKKKGDVLSLDLILPSTLCFLFILILGLSCRRPLYALLQLGP